MPEQRRARFRRFRAAPILSALAVGLAAPAAAPAQDPDPRPEFVILGLGDSYSSGEGNPEVDGIHDAQGRPGVPEQWLATGTAAEREDHLRCHRSPLSWQHRVARAIQDAYPAIRVTFRSFACGGAKIRDEGSPRHGGALDGYEGAEPGLRGLPLLPPQIEQANAFLREREQATGRPPKVDAVLMTFGGNDANFATVVGLCLGDLVRLQGDALTTFAGAIGGILGPPGAVIAAILAEAALSDSLRHCDTNPIARMALNDGLAKLPERYAALDAALRGAGSGPRLLVPAASVFISEYPDPSHDAAGRLCDGTGTDPVYRRVVLREARFIRDEIVPALADAVTGAWDRPQEERRAVTGARQDARNHGGCADAQRWFRTNDEGLRSQGNDVTEPEVALVFSHPVSAALAHPNPPGHAAMAARATAQVRGFVERRFVPGIPTLVRGSAVAAAQRRLPARAGQRLGPCTATGCLDVRWTTPGAADATGYRVEIRGAGGRVALRDLPPTARSYRHRGSGRFAFRVQACGAGGCAASTSGFSNTVLMSNVRPRTPEDLRRTRQRFAGTIDLAWTPADGFASSYDVESRRILGEDAPPAVAGVSEAAVLGAFIRSGHAAGRLSGGRVQNVPVPSARLGSPVARLGAGDVYEVRVRACSDTGCSAFGDRLVVPVTEARGEEPMLDVPQRIIDPDRLTEIPLTLPTPGGGRPPMPLDLRLVGSGGVVGCLSLDPTQARVGLSESRCPQGVRATRPLAGSGTLGSRSLRLDVRRTRTVGAVRRGRDGRARIAIRATSRLAGESLRLEAAARDSRGGRLGYRTVGTLAVRKR
jgi:hypothetical protein